MTEVAADHVDRVLPMAPIRQWVHPLLDFGDARDRSFFPDLKVASVKSAAPFAPGKGRPLKRLFDHDLGWAYQASGWPESVRPSFAGRDLRWFFPPCRDPGPQGPAGAAR